MRFAARFALAVTFSSGTYPTSGHVLMACVLCRYGLLPEPGTLAWLEGVLMRAALADLADPGLLADPDIALTAVDRLAHWSPGRTYKALLQLPLIPVRWDPQDLLYPVVAPAAK
jgi:hypothetical protein